VVGIVTLSLVNSFLIILVQNREQRGVILTVQVFMCIFLLADAFYRVLRAPNKRRFLARPYNWLYFVGSLPIPFVCVVRLVPIWIIVRRMGQEEYQVVERMAIRRRAQNTLLSVILVAIVVLESGSIMILGAERHAIGSNIKSAEDALWWAVVTIATVGYGDRYPTTTVGRIIGVFMMVVGVAVFTSLSSFLAQWFLRQRSAQAQPTSETGAALVGDAAVPVSWEALRTLLDDREEAHRREVQELRDRLAAFESAQQDSSGRPLDHGMDRGAVERS
jgi:voltage-gated potassium channel